jgi:N-carbamoyl-L-amino-acid hydrolase
MDRQTESERTALISRRAFLGGMMGAAALPTFALRASVGKPAHPAHPAFALRASAGKPALLAPDLRVDARALRERIEKLSTFGRPAGGTFADGVSRIAYSDADIEGRRYVMGLMTAAGLKPSIDPAGNIFARRPGTDSGRPPILFGSHIDSVPNGGNFDGDLGSLSALGVLEALQAADVRTRHPLEVVVWAHEEGFAFGRGLACSRIVAGEIAAADMDEVWNGMRRGEAIRRIGGNPDRILEARRP